MSYAEGRLYMRPSFDWNATADLFEEATSAVTASDYEERLKAFTQGPPQMDWSVPEAFLAVLLAAAHADFEVTAEEEEQIKGLRKRSRLLKSLPNEKIRKALTSAQEKLKLRPDDGLKAACECLPHVLRMPVFALAVDIVLADGKLLDSEEAFIEKISKWLSIDKAIDWQIKRIMLIKNNC